MINSSSSIGEVREEVRRRHEEPMTEERCAHILSLMRDGTKEEPPALMHYGGERCWFVGMKVDTLDHPLFNEAQQLEERGLIFYAGGGAYGLTVEGRALLRGGGDA